MVKLLLLQSNLEMVKLLFLQSNLEMVKLLFLQSNLEMVKGWSESFPVVQKDGVGG
jgi:hypothetical protein